MIDFKLDNCPTRNEFVEKALRQYCGRLHAERTSAYLPRALDMEFWESTYGIEIPLPGDHGLADAMARLPAAYRDILLLRYYNGYSVREISSMLHIKKDTAQKQLWRAKAALQKHLKGDA